MSPINYYTKMVVLLVCPKNRAEPEIPQNYMPQTSLKQKPSLGSVHIELAKAMSTLLFLIKICQVDIKSESDFSS